ncbi:MAG: DUF736 family protein [Phyllobacterium sp.]|jgi:uncharacterized protein (DUF736 family)|uniref:DUF736 family protein n=1 Tax=Phyllobacterium sp. TaxID=1871046 RepID=UPI0030F041E0
MTDLVNFIKINGDKITGNVETLSFFVDITGEALVRNNDKAPVFRLFGKSPRGRLIEIGGIWEKENQKGGTYYSLGIKTGHGKFYANLGKHLGQDDETLYAVITND